MRILKLPRTTPVGSLIYRLKASAAQENPLSFVIANGTDINLITIKSVDFYQANVYLSKPLQEKEYNFTIYVTDGVERTLVDCQIIVENGSQLMTSSFIHFRPLLSVPESASFNSTIGYIHVKERDNSNLPVTFEIEGSDCFGIRYIFGPKGTSKAEIYLKTQLDFEAKNLFRLQVYALNAWTNETFDTRNIVMKELIITVINEQDTPPVFKQMPHLIQLTEATEVGDVVLTLHAIDGDQELDRKIKYYLRQEDELHKHFQVDADTGEVVIRGTIDSLRELVGHENLFTLTFVAKEVDQEESARLTGRKLDIHNYEIDHLVDGPNEELPGEADSHNHYIVNDKFYDDGPSDNLPVSSDLLAVDSRTSDQIDPSVIKATSGIIDSKKNESQVNQINSRTKDDKAKSLASLQSINHMILNRIPLKSTPINMPPSIPQALRKRMLHDASKSNAHEISHLLKPPINLTNELNRIDLTTTTRPTTKANTAFYVTSKPMTIKSTTLRPFVNKFTLHQTAATHFLPSQPAKKSLQSSNSISSIISKPLDSIIPKIINQQNVSSRILDVNLVNDNLIADEHYIVNNLTSIGLMDKNFKPENLVQPDSSENSRLNSERATAMNAVLNELSSTSRTETEINVGFIILQIGNHAPEFPMVRPNSTNSDDLLFIMFGQIEENSRQNSWVQLEQELLIVDQDHGLNGTFDVQISDPTKTFDIHPKNGYRNQTFQIQLVDSNQLRLMENKQVNLKIIVTDRSPFKSLRNELVVSVRVLDTNNEFPQFTRDLFRATINEKEQVGTVITRVLAFDTDSGDYGQITYSHLLGDLSSNLALNQQTGEITLVSLENIDREKQDLYTLIIYVCDNHCKPEESNSNQTLLLIDILDFNDNRPEFEIARYDYLLNSDLFTFSSPIQVRATDADESNTQNSNVTYEIISGNLQNKFKINELTGEIQLVSPLLLEGSETLPITDLENDEPAGNNLEDGENGVEKSHIIDYPWTEDNFDLVHLDNLFSYFSPVINLTIRAHDQGIPILDNYINVYIHCQNYINRTVVFLVNDSELTVKRKKSEYERNLSEMSSGRVRIKSIQEPPSATNLPNRTLVYSTITYPSQSVINVNKVNWYSAKILSAPPNMLNVPGGWSWFNLTGTNRQGRNQLDTVNTHSVKTAGLDNNNFITWLLIMIILISLIFLFILIAIWCYFCGCRKRKNKINSADSANYYNHHLKTQQMNKQLLKHQQSESDSIDSQQATEYGHKATDVKQLPAQRTNYQMSEFDASAFNGRFKKRIKPGSAVFENTGYVSDADPSGNFILTARKPHSAPDNKQRTYVDDTGVFTSDKVDYYDRGLDIDRVQSSPLYTEDAYSILNRVWFGDRGEKQQPASQQSADQQREPVPDMYATVRRNKVKFTDEGESSGSEEISGRRVSQDETSVKQLLDKHRTASQLTLRSQVDQVEPSDAKGAKPDSFEQDDLTSKLPKAILKNTDQQKRSSTNVSPTSDTDSGIGHKEAGQQKKIERESAKHSGPPTPPPLPSMTSQQVHHVSAQKLHLKNEDVAQKKSVFTIAYNGVKTDRLNSADSSTVYI